MLKDAREVHSRPSTQYQCCLANRNSDTKRSTGSRTTQYVPPLLPMVLPSPSLLTGFRYGFNSGPLRIGDSPPSSRPFSTGKHAEGLWGRRNARYELELD